MDDEFLFDSIIGFLRSPMWQIPIQHYFEKNCIVFTMDSEGDEFRSLHREYKQLVEDLLVSYLQDLGIKPEEVVTACRTAKTGPNANVFKAILESLWAADDYELFRQLMVRKNVELELQSLAFIQQVFGIVLSGDEELLARVLETTKLEDDDEQPVDKSDKEVAEAIMHENRGLMTELLQEKKERDRAVEKEVQKVMAEPDVKRGAEEKRSGARAKAAAKEESSDDDDDDVVTSGAAATTNRWLEVAREEGSQLTAERRIGSATKLSKEEIARRAGFLKQQREALMAQKQATREQQLKVMASERPRSARVAKAAITQDKSADQQRPNDEKAMQLRRALATRLKEEVVQNKKH